MTYVGWILLLIVAFFIVEASTSWVLGWVYYILVILVILALLVIRRPARVASVNRRISPSTAEIDQPVMVQVTVGVEPVRMPGWVMVQDSVPQGFREVNACAKLMNSSDTDDTTFFYQIKGSLRGYYTIGPLTVTTGDYFGLAQSQAKTEERPAFLTIHPRVYPVPPVCIPSNRPIGDAPSMKRIYEDTTRIVGVRDYQPGDALSRIHWKTTARTGTLTTKMCEASTSIEVNLVLNLYLGDYPDRMQEVELACTAAASVASSLLMDKQVVGLMANGNDAVWRYGAPRDPWGCRVKADRGTHQLTEILDLLGRLELGDEFPFPDYITRVHSTLPWTSTTLIISHYVNDESALAMESLRRAGFEIAAIIVGSGEYAEASRDRVAALGAPVAMIPTEKDLAYLEFWRAGVN